MKHLRYISIGTLVATALFLLGISPQIVFATTDTFTANGTWTAPAGVFSVQVNAWAGGGGGGLGNGSSGGGAGGGGGGFASLTTFPVTPGNVYTVSVGGGGIGSTGTNAASSSDSMFNASSTLLAKGGGPGKDIRGLIGVGGVVADEVGDTKFAGGNGGIGASPASTNFGGGAGGGAGTTQNGSNGVAGGTTGAGGGGGSVGGGAGGSHGSPGGNGNTLGGGGAGGDVGNGGNGARGEVDITYTASIVTPAPQGVVLTNTSVQINNGKVIIN